MRYLFQRHDKSPEEEEHFYWPPRSISIWHRNKLIRRVQEIHHTIWIPHYGLYLFGPHIGYFFQEHQMSYYNVIRHREEGKNHLISLLDPIIKKGEPVLLEDFFENIATHWFFSYRSSIMRSFKRALKEYNLHVAIDIFMEEDLQNPHALRPVIALQWKKPPRKEPIHGTQRVIHSRTQRRIPSQQMSRGY